MKKMATTTKYDWENFSAKGLKEYIKTHPEDKGGICWWLGI